MQKEKIKGIALIAFIILIGLIAQLYNKNIQKKEKIFSVGTIVKIASTASLEMKATFSYSINGEKYENSENTFGHEDIFKVGRSFVVSIPIGHDNHGLILIDHPVPNGIKAPVEGWSELPNFDKLK